MPNGRVRAHTRLGEGPLPVHLVGVHVKCVVAWILVVVVLVLFPQLNVRVVDENVFVAIVALMLVVDSQNMHHLVLKCHFIRAAAGGMDGVAPSSALRQRVQQRHNSANVGAVDFREVEAWDAAMKTRHRRAEGTGKVGVDPCQVEAVHDVTVPRRTAQASSKGLNTAARLGDSTIDDCGHN